MTSQVSQGVCSTTVLQPLPVKGRVVMRANCLSANLLKKWFLLRSESDHSFRSVPTGKAVTSRGAKLHFKSAHYISFQLFLASRLNLNSRQKSWIFLTIAKSWRPYWERQCCSLGVMGTFRLRTLRNGQVTGHRHLSQLASSRKAPVRGSLGEPGCQFLNSS